MVCDGNPSLHTLPHTPTASAATAITSTAIKAKGFSLRRMDFTRATLPVLASVCKGDRPGRPPPQDRPPPDKDYHERREREGAGETRRRPVPPGRARPAARR